MKKITKRLLTAGILIATTFFTIKAQTNVSGGIYSNTTWIKANSPYIVTDTIVVFPGVTLTIQPGVTVKFANDKRIELRQASLVAEGSLLDSIIFTSNSSSPTIGIWASIYLNGGTMASRFSYCTLKYADRGINAIAAAAMTVSDSLIIKNSNFEFNNSGVYFMGYGGLHGEPVTGVALIDSCNCKNNVDYGMLLLNLISKKINDCNFSNNGTGLSTDRCPVNNCIFNLNQTGLKSSYVLANNCHFVYNQTGINSNSENVIKNCVINSNSVTGISANGDTVSNCEIKYNDVGVQAAISTIIGNDIEYNRIDINDNVGWNRSIITGNTIKNSTVGIDNVHEAFIITQNIIENDSIGIRLYSSGAKIHCNEICNNYNYDLKYGASTNIDISGNYWCAADSSSISASIYDGYDNINYGLVKFMPFDTSQCYLLTTGIPVYENQNFSFNIFPNPVTDYLTVALPKETSKPEIKIFNMLGELQYSTIATKQNMNIDISSFARGIYFIQVNTIKNTSSQKFIKQ